jgi:hypothetical protein
MPDDPSRPPNFDADLEPGDLPGEGGQHADSGLDGGGGDEPVVQSRPDTAAIEAEARDMGWIPRAAFRGDKARWVDAGTYVRRAKEVLPIIKSREEKTRAENEDLKRQLAELREGQKEYQEDKQRRADAQRKFELANLKNQRKTALENQDMDAVNDIDIKLIELNAKPAPNTPTTPARAETPDPKTQAQWNANVQKYPFLADKRAEEDWHAEGIALRMAGNRDVGEAFIARVNDRMRRLYPEHFTTRRHAMVEGGGSPSGGNGAGGSHTFADLLPEYQREFAKNGKKIGMSRAEFLAECGPECFGD